MGSAANLLIEDYESKRAELQHLDVELAGGTLRIYYAPVMNVKQQAAIYKHIDMVTGSMSTEVFLESMLVRALNEDGTRMFKDVDRQELSTKVDQSVLAEIAAKMGGVVEKADPKA